MPALTYKNFANQMYFEAPTAKTATGESESDLRKKQADALGLVHRGGMYYSKDEEGEITHRSLGAKIVTLPPSEKKRAARIAKATVKPDVKQPSPDAGAPAKKIGSTGRTPVARSTAGMSKDQFSTAMKSRLDDSLGKLNNSPALKSVSGQFAPDFRKFFGRIDSISKMGPGKKRRVELESLISNFGLTLGSGKLYANHFTNKGGLYKVFGNALPRDAQYLLDMIEQEGIDITQSTDKKENAKHYLAGQSKPNFGKPFKINDPTVQTVFGENPVMDSLEPRYKSLFGPASPDGTLARSGGANAKLFFTHSVESNVGVARVTEALDELMKSSGQNPTDTTGYAGVANSLKSYKNNMKSALAKFDTMPAKARRELVGQIYARLAHDMFTADKEIASSIMKNMAELALYDTEIAGGDEAYLPSEGNFPSGDKIVVTRKGAKVEKIESVSIKFGQNSDGTFGMPGEAGKICLYHPDARYRDLLDSRAGRAGYELGVRGDMIHDEGTFQSMLSTAGFGKCFDKKTVNEIRELGVAMTEVTKSFKRNHPRSKNGELTGELLGGVQNDPKMQALWTRLHETLQKGDQKQLMAAMGESNYKNTMKPNQHAMSFYSLMAFGAALKTSDGFTTLLHNHQVYKKGQFISETSEGTPNLQDWKCKSIFYGARAGGMKAGFAPAH